MHKYDLIIIGGGAAGMMAAISARRHHPNMSIAIVDRTFALGRKILVCGAGRCNITNKNLSNQIAEHYYGAPLSFIEPVFSEFGYPEIVEFFNDLGIDLYVERKTDIGKLFPVTNQAHTVNALLLDEIESGGIKISLNTEVTKIIPENGKFRLEAKQYDLGTKQVSTVIFESTKLIISAGGKTYPALGSDGSGFSLAEELGHKIITPVPSALPLEAKNALSQLVQGVKFELEVTSVINGEDIKTRTDDVMFTKYGLSGPAILNISREISIHLNRNGGNSAEVRINFLPGRSYSQILRLLTERWQKRPEQTLEKSLFGLLPNKLVSGILKVLRISTTLRVKQVDSQIEDRLVQMLSGYTIKVTATRGWNEAEFTAGGIDTAEVTPQMQSRKIPNLYFCGEILNVDGDVGGFNLSWSWSSGWVAGQLRSYT